MRSALPESMLLDAPAMKTILSIIQGNRIDDNTWVHEVTVGQSGDELTLLVTVGPFEVPGVDLAGARQNLLGRLAAQPNMHTRVTLNQPAIRRVVARVDDVPSFGWTSFRAAAPRHLVQLVGERGLTNGLVSIDFDAANGTYSVNGVAGFGRLVDVGDLGDSYNYSPPSSDRCVDEPIEVRFKVEESGPIRGRVSAVATYEWPEYVDELSQQRLGTVRVEITTTVELRADETAVRVSTTFVNPARDHRLRVHLPLIEPTDHSLGECAFTVIERGLTAEGRPEEFGLPTFPSRRFVQAGGVTVAHEGLHEYELTDIRDGVAHEIALTLLRSTGMLSRLGMTYRPLPAGPLTPVAGLQMVGQTITSRYSVVVGPCDPYRVADDLLVPLDAVGASGGGAREGRGSRLDVRGANVSSVRRVAGVLEIRVFNPSPSAVVVEVKDQRGWLVDLRGRGLEMFEGSFVLRAHGIATFRLLESE